MNAQRNLVSLLPHRAPLLFLEHAEMTDEPALVARQTIPADDIFLSCHFPGFPMWPGVLLSEAMAQTTAIYLLSERSPLSNDVPVLGAVDIRFLKPVFPGDVIHYSARMIRRIADLGLFSVTATRGTEVVARGRISAGITARAALTRPAER
jgi:3-hydroxyacyl-[acyl-carrier-protein] dehydratase